MTKITAIVTVLAGLPLSGVAQEKDLTRMSLEDLLNLEVTSVSKKEQRIYQTPAATFVITQDAIRRSGATNIPDLLRMAPGVNVARINAGSWAISIRGFNGRYSNKLLVLLDGREVYTPTFGGVFWDVLDLPLENIERIEVVRGPGGSIWGTNAVNGVINILTKAASAAPGLMVSTSGGPDERLATIQYGGKLGRNTTYRAFSRYTGYDDFQSLGGGAGGDGWHVLRGGFRSDTALSPRDALTVQGDLYSGMEGVPTAILPSITSQRQIVDWRTDLSGGFLQSVWDHVLAGGSDVQVKASFTRYRRMDVLGETRNSVNLGLQHHFAAGRHHDVIWGVDYDFTRSHANGSLTFSFNPASQNGHRAAAFIQDEIALVPNRLHFSAGGKVERNYYGHVELMPSVRLAWMPTNKQTLWAGLSLADCSPNTATRSMRANLAGFSGPGGLPGLAVLLGNPRVSDEELTAYEFGYRRAFGRRVSVDLAAYSNHYSDLQTTEPADPFFEQAPPPPHLVVPLTFGNLMRGTARGFEAAASWKVTEHWALSTGYAFEHLRMRLDPGSRDTGAASLVEGSSPAHSAQLRSSLDLGSRASWDVSANFTGRLNGLAIPPYTRLDTGLSWRWTEALSVRIVGQDLLKRRHLEFVESTGSVESTWIGRRVYVAFTWQF